MDKPRYDDVGDVSRHAATDFSCCKTMAKNYGWQLKRVEKIHNSSIFKHDCVFAGKTAFPRSFNETEADWES
jgi:hypothetical protein